MPIISISLNTKILDELDRLKKNQGYTSRSEIIRTASRMLISDTKEKESLKGRLNATLIIIHAPEDEYIISEIKHQYNDIITTQIHNHLKDNKCLEIFVLDGDAAKIIKLTQVFRATKKVEYVKLIVA